MKESQVPIPKHINDFLDWIDIEKGLSNKTQENYRRFLEKFLVWLKSEKLEALLPHQLTSDHIWDYRVFLSRKSLHNGQPLKKATQSCYLIALRAFLGYFVAKDLLSLPPDKITLSRPDKEKTVKFLTLEQLNKLFSAPDNTTIQGMRDRAILETFFSTGMRISELTSLNREQIKIRPGIEDLELGIVGKGGRARTVYFSKNAIKWLEKYISARDSNKEDKEKALFINYSGKKNAPRRLTPRAIEKNLKRYIVLSGLPANTTPHVLRHSFATDLLNQGVDMRLVQEFLGHKSILATQIYTHVTNKRLRDVHKKFHGNTESKNN